MSAKLNRHEFVRLPGESATEWCVLGIFQDSHYVLAHRDWQRGTYLWPIVSQDALTPSGATPRRK